MDRSGIKRSARGETNNSHIPKKRNVVRKLLQGKGAFLKVFRKMVYEVKGRWRGYEIGRTKQKGGRGGGEF